MFCLHLSNAEYRTKRISDILVLAYLVFSK